MTDFVVITDMDGTLLHPSTYSFGPAGQALEMLKKRNVPVVLCTSKTRAEVEVWRGELENTDPFITENGGGVFVPTGYFPFPCGESRAEGYGVVTLGTSYEEIRRVFEEVREETGAGVKGFGDMDTREVAVATGLSLEEAELARRREFDEPFIFESASDRRNFLNRLESRGLRWTEGGRFYHATGDNDKGRAVELLRGFFLKAGRRVTAIGLGDGMNDEPMLRAVDIPVLVEKEDGTYERRIDLEGIRLAEGVGPEGWNMVITELIREDERRSR